MEKSIFNIKTMYFLLKIEQLFEQYETGFRFPDEFLLMSLVWLQKLAINENFTFLWIISTGSTAS